MFTGHDKRSDSNTRADLHLLIHSLPLRSAGGKDAAHFPAVTGGEELQTCAGIISQECSLHSQAAVTCWAEREGTGSKTCCFSGTPLPLLQAESSSWTTPAVGWRRGWQGRCGHWCHHTLTSFEPRTTGQGDRKRISDPGPKLVEDKRATEGQLLPPLPPRPKREPKKVKDRLFLLINPGQVLGTLAAPSPARHKKLCSIWSFSEARG